MHDELVLITNPDFKADYLSGNQFIASTLLMREQGSGSRRVVETALEKAGAKLKSFKTVKDLHSTEAIKSAVEPGLGVGFDSRCAIAEELKLGLLKVGASRPRQSHKRFFSCFAHGARSPRTGGGASHVRSLTRSSSFDAAPKVALGKRFRRISAANQRPELPLRQRPSPTSDSSEPQWKEPTYSVLGGQLRADLKGKEIIHGRRKT